MNTNNNYPMIDYNRDFIRVGKQLFKEYGFQYSNKCFYRKNNRIFQAFNLSVPGCIALTIVPFWCDLKASGIYDNLRLSVAICDGVFKPSSFVTDYYNFNCPVSSFEELINELKSTAKTMFEEIDKVIDERTYVDYLSKKRRYFNCCEEAILFVAHEESKMNIATDWIRKLEYFSLDEYIWNLEKLPAEALCETNSEKQNIDHVFFEEYWRNDRVRFPKLYEYVSNKNIDFESFYEKESIKMRDIYKCHYKLYF